MTTIFGARMALTGCVPSVTTAQLSAEPWRTSLPQTAPSTGKSPAGFFSRDSYQTVLSRNSFLSGSGRFSSVPRHAIQRFPLWKDSLFTSRYLEIDDGDKSIPVELLDSNPVYIPAEDRTKQVIRQIWPSVVSLHMTGTEVNPETGKEETSKWLGTGFVVSARDLNLPGYTPKKGEILIATNYHVANNAQTTKLSTKQGLVHEGNVRVLVADETSDIAILVVQASHLNLKPVPLGSTDDIEQGDFVLAFGHPYGLPFRVTSGIINNTDFDREEFIQTDAAINPGNSGGPLVDLGSGRVVGMNTFIYKDANAMGFAVPIWLQFARLRDVWEQERQRPRKLAS